MLLSVTSFTRIPACGTDYESLNFAITIYSTSSAIVSLVTPLHYVSSFAMLHILYSLAVFNLGCE